jgi:hypothetical protein
MRRLWTATDSHWFRARLARFGAGWFGVQPSNLIGRFADATARVADMLISAMRPGARQRAAGQGARHLRREGVPDPAAAVILFHGLGLSHMDIEQTLADGRANGD